MVDFLFCRKRSPKSVAAAVEEFKFDQPPVTIVEEAPGPEEVVAAPTPEPLKQVLQKQHRSRSVADEDEVSRVSLPSIRHTEPTPSPRVSVKDDDEFKFVEPKTVSD